MDRARRVDGTKAVDAVNGVDAADGTTHVVDPLAEEIRQSIFLLVGALGLMGVVAIALLALTTGSGG